MSVKKQKVSKPTMNFRWLKIKRSFGSAALLQQQWTLPNGDKEWKEINVEESSS